MSSRIDNLAAQSVDPGNDLLWRQRLRRLEAESVWDTVLTVTGELNRKFGGRGFFPHLNGEVLAGQSRPGMDWEVSTPDEQARRSIYTYIRRTMLVPLLDAFDYSNTTSPLTERPVTTVAPQALMLLNAEWAQQRAAAFARRLAREGGPRPEDRIAQGYQLALGRQPTAAEVDIALAFIQRQEAAGRVLNSRLTFRPDMPNSLYGEFMKQLPASDYLRGPSSGWTYYKGRWSAGYEGIRTLDRDRGPFALWNGKEFSNGIIQATVLLDRAADFGAILFRSKSDGQEQRGGELVLDARRQRLALREPWRATSNPGRSPGATRLWDTNGRAHRAGWNPDSCLGSGGQFRIPAAHHRCRSGAACRRRVFRRSRVWREPEFGECAGAVRG